MDKVELKEIIEYYENNLQHQYKSFLKMISALLEEDPLFQEVHPLIKYRLKSSKSLKQKIKEKHDDENRPITSKNLGEEIEDIAGFRIIVYDKVEQELVKKWIISQGKKAGIWVVHDRVYYKSPLEDVKDQMGDDSYTDFKKEYRSYHFILLQKNSKDSIKCEVQIRTIFEEAIFENQHRIFYKPKKSIEGSLKIYMQSTFTELANICSISDSIITNTYKFIDDDRLEYFSEKYGLSRD